MPINSQGAPSTGEIPQYWGNGIFQSWGNPPVLGKQCFFFPDFDTEDGKIESYNYFFKCRISNTLWKYFIFWDYQRYFWIIAEKSKNYIHFSPVLGKFLTFGEILLKQNLPQYWGNIWPVEDVFHLVSAQNSQEIVQTHHDSCGMLKIASLELSRQVLNVENATDSQNLNSSRKVTM